MRPLLRLRGVELVLALRRHVATTAPGPGAATVASPAVTVVEAAAALSASSASNASSLSPSPASSAPFLLYGASAARRRAAGIRGMSKTMVIIPAVAHLVERRERMQTSLLTSLMRCWAFFIWLTTISTLVSFASRRAACA